jgi:hypothetical protein
MQNTPTMFTGRPKIQKLVSKKTKIKFASIFIKKKRLLYSQRLAIQKKKYIRIVIKIELFYYSKFKDTYCSIYIMVQTLDTCFSTVAKLLCLF